MNTYFYKTVWTIYFFTLTCFAFGQAHFFIANRDNNNVLKFTLEGEFVLEFVQSGSGGLRSPQEVLFHPEDGSLLVTGFNNTRIKRYDGETGSYLGDFSRGYNLSLPTKMIIGDDNLLYVTQWGRTQNKIVRFDLDGNFIDEWSKINVPEGCGMAWDQEGNLYVTTWSNGQDNGNVGFVRKFDSEGNHLGIVVSTANVQGPVGIWIDEAGDLFVIDWTFGGVKQFDSNGNFKRNFIRGMGRTEGNGIGPDGKYYLCDWQRNRVNRYNADGSFDKILVTQRLNVPNGFAFEPSAVVSSSEVQKEAFVQINTYPNPAKEVIYLDFIPSGSEPIYLQIYDLLGKSVLSQKVDRQNFTKAFSLNLHSFEKGIYQLILTQGEKQMSSTFEKL